MVQNRLIETGEEFSYPELERISNYCNSALHGLSFDEAKRKIERELEADYARYDKLMKSAMSFSKQVFDGVPDSELVIDGQLQLIDLPEFAEAERFRELVGAIDEKKRILNVLLNCEKGEGVSIFVGVDARDSGIESLGIVGAPYYKDGNVVGALGVIGPMRMDYSRIVSIVDFTSKVLSDILEA
jgi:heat-inducible transcriptional repressor